MGHIYIIEKPVFFAEYMVIKQQIYFTLAH